jgi:hypothetical protein
VRLASVKAGDIVRVDDGQAWLATVYDVPERGRVRVTPITGPRGMRTVTAREIVAHWRLVKART